MIKFNFYYIALILKLNLCLQTQNQNSQYHTIANIIFTSWKFPSRIYFKSKINRKWNFIVESIPKNNTKSIPYTSIMFFANIDVHWNISLLGRAKFFSLSIKSIQDAGNRRGVKLKILVWGDNSRERRMCIEVADVLVVNLIHVSRIRKKNAMWRA